MQLIIDNFNTLGPMDYSTYLDAEHLPRVARRLNKPSVMLVQLVFTVPGTVVPREGARVLLQKDDGGLLFGGYLAQEPVCEYLGPGSGGDITRYELRCESDEWLLDRKALPQRLPFVSRAAGAILTQLTQDVQPGAFDTSAIANCDVVPVYPLNVQQTWSEHAAELGLWARAFYRAENGKITFAPVEANVINIDELETRCDRAALKIESRASALNDVMVVGLSEPRTYVKDYFEGDGYTLMFPLAESPMETINHTIFKDTFPGTQLNTVLWQDGIGSTARVNNGQLIATGNACVQLVELVEIGGGVVLQHGCFEFQGANSGILGGLYSGGLGNGNCVAGFLLQPSGAQSTMQAIVNGVATGVTLTTAAGHQYQLTTRVFADELYRSSQVFHSSQHPSGNQVGGETISSDARVVLEIHDVDPNNPATMGAPSTVLYDAVISRIPGWCTYALMNGNGLHCNVSSARMLRNGGVLVRAAVPGQPFQTLLQGSLVNGSQCRVTMTSLNFLAAYVPEAGEQIVVSYRAGGTSKAEVQNALGIAALANGTDDGIRSSVRGLQVPEARSSEDCTNAALALLDDGAQTAYRGEYTTWSDFLGTGDTHPGDGVAVNSPSQDAVFTAIIREVDIAVEDLRNDRSVYHLKFANDAAETLSYSFEKAKLRLPAVGVSVPANWNLPPVKDAQFTQILDSQVTIATNLAPLTGGGFEVRGLDEGWGAANDRNLIGRFALQSFTAPRLSRSQCYYIRQYDGAQPPNYSRDATLLHVDWPL